MQLHKGLKGLSKDVWFSVFRNWHHNQKPCLVRVLICYLTCIQFNIFYFESGAQISQKNLNFWNVMDRGRQPKAHGPKAAPMSHPQMKPPAWWVPAHCAKPVHRGARTHFRGTGKRVCTDTGARNRRNPAHGGMSAGVNQPRQGKPCWPLIMDVEVGFCMCTSASILVLTLHEFRYQNTGIA